MASFRPGVRSFKFGPSFSALDFDKFKSSIENLPAIITSNGISVLPTYRYKAEDAGTSTWKKWGYGEDLTLQAGTAPTISGESNLLGERDYSVVFNAGGYYRNDGSAAFGSIGLNDFVIEIIASHPDPTANDKCVLSKAISVAAWDGNKHAWSGGRLYNTFGNGVSAVNTSTDVLSAGGIYHVMFFGNRSENSTNSSVPYVNGVAGTGANISTVTGSVGTRVSAVNNLSIGATSVGGELLTNASHVYYVAMWNSLDWHQEGASGPTEWATIAKKRFTQLCGLYPQRDDSGVYVPTFTRSTISYCDKIDKNGNIRIYQVGAGFPKISARSGSDGGRMVRGLLIETGSVNMHSGSDLMTTNWGAITAGSVTSNNWTPPNGSSEIAVGDTLNEDATVDTRTIIRSANSSFSTVLDKYYCISFYAKTYTQGGLLIYPFSSDGPQTNWNLATGAVTSVNAGWSNFPIGGVENLGNNTYRCWTSFQAGRNGFFRCALQTLDSAQVANHAGCNGSSASVWGFQAETNVKYPTSYYPTPSTTVATRVADVLYYTMNSSIIDPAKGSVRCNLLSPDTSLVSGSYVFSLNDGTTSNSISAYLNPSTNRLVFECINGGTNQFGITGSTDMADGLEKKIEVNWGGTNCEMKINNSTEASATGVYTFPTMTRLYVGSDANGTLQSNAIVSKLKVYKSNKGLR
ncbi:MAG: hypothetical protein Q8P81_04350 [Nanoarchaeota archaeon]|nr:hypothetical protein [Nanoarchaeota archaeon]